MIRALVASNTPVIRAGLRAILEDSGRCEVVGEALLGDLVSPATALAPEVILLDLPLGEQDGLEALWRLAAEVPQVAVVVLTGETGEAGPREYLQAGARGYLLRDVSPEELVAAIEAAQQGLTVLHPSIAHDLLAAPSSPAQPTTGEPLTAREVEVLRLLAQGLPSKTIATRLRISEHTVKFHVGSILGKLGAASRTEAVALALRRGLVAL